MSLLSRTFAILDSRLDRSALGRRWQRQKWRIAYRFRAFHAVLPFETLIEQPRRAFLVDAVAAFAEVRSVLEVGCGRGANLYLISKALPHASLIGIDISSSAIAGARSDLAAHGVSNVRLDVDDFLDLSDFADSSVDVVVADAVLFYVPPSHIGRAVEEILRVAARGAVLCTWDLQVEGNREPWSYDDGAWIYDLRRLLGPARANVVVERVPVPREVWPDKRWRQYGVILKLTIDR